MGGKLESRSKARKNSRDKVEIREQNADKNLNGCIPVGGSRAEERKER